MASRAALFLPELKKAWRACAHSSLGHKGREGSGVPVGGGGPPPPPRTWQDRPGGIPAPLAPPPPSQTWLDAAMATSAPGYRGSYPRQGAPCRWACPLPGHWAQVLGALRVGPCPRGVLVPSPGRERC